MKDVLVYRFGVAGERLLYGKGGGGGGVRRNGRKVELEGLKG